MKDEAVVGSKKANNRKAQGETEYLLTLTWAILIMAIVLAILFGLGIFNFSYQPKAPPGACQVLRSVGPGGTILTGYLTGACSNELPQYVAGFRNQGTWVFNCANKGSCIGLSNIFGNTPVCNVTLSVWSYDAGDALAGGYTGWAYNTWFAGVGAEPSSGSLAGVISIYNISATGAAVPTKGAENIEYNDTLMRYEVRNSVQRNQLFFKGNFLKRWLFSTIVLNNGYGFAYTNGTAVPVTGATPYIGCVKLRNGTIGTWDTGFNGQISNVQIYNKSLTASEVSTLYKEGVGGTPIDLQYLVGWWPLNGNNNDYSGNGHNGYENNVSGSGVWSTDYKLG